MHITELRLNKNAGRLVRDVQAMHGAVAYAADPHPHLWALPRSETLVIAAPKPIRAEAFRGVVTESHSAEMVTRWESGQRVKVSLIGNPTASQFRRGERGKKVSLPPEKWEEWVIGRLAPIRLESVDARHHRVAHGTRHGKRLTITQVAFSGVGTVSDTDALENLIVSGVGRGKAYGCGLLLVVPA